MTLSTRPRLRWFLTTAVALLSVGPFVIALAALSGHGHRWVDILAQFVGPALVAVVLLLAAALVLRSRVAGTVAGLSLAFVIVAGTPQWFRLHPLFRQSVRRK